MRRRLRADRRLAPDELVALASEVSRVHSGGPPEFQRHAMRQALADAGYTPLDVVRASHWLRAGKPADYRWDDPLVPRTASSQAPTHGPGGDFCGDSRERLRCSAFA